MSKKEEKPRNTSNLLTRVKSLEKSNRILRRKNKELEKATFIEEISKISLIVQSKNTIFNACSKIRFIKQILKKDVPEPTDCFNTDSDSESSSCSTIAVFQG